MIIPDLPQLTRQWFDSNISYHRSYTDTFWGDIWVAEMTVQVSEFSGKKSSKHNIKNVLVKKSYKKSLIEIGLKINKIWRFEIIV